MLGLTPAEANVAVLLAEGWTVREIAASTDRRYHTVRSHLRNIFAKLGVSRQVDVVYAVVSLSNLAESIGLGTWATALQHRRFLPPEAGPNPNERGERILARRLALRSVDAAANLTWRIAFAPTARRWRYPLPVSGELKWRADNITQAEIPLPRLPPAHIIVPSFSSPGGSDHRWCLDCGDASSVTGSFGGPAGQYAHFDGVPGIDVKRDYFTTSRILSNARLRLLIDASEPPGDYLVTVGIRPAHIAVNNSPMPDTPILGIRAKGELAGLKWEFFRHMCDTSCVSMAMDYLGVIHPFHELVVGAHHRATNTYGVWPQNLWAASRWGVIGAIETTSDESVLRRALAGGHPLAASIAFNRGELQGSAIPWSPGHMVIVRGIEDGQVAVNDPAAKDAMNVSRRYHIEEFLRAWLMARGIHYLFAIST